MPAIRPAAALALAALLTACATPPPPVAAPSSPAATSSPAALHDPIARSLHFDSRSAAHKTPFGAVVAGTEVGFSVQAQAGVQQMWLVVETRQLAGNQDQLAYNEIARVPMQRSASAATGIDTWSARYRFDAVAVHGYWFDAIVGDRHYALQNNTDTVHWTREKGSGGAAVAEPLPANQASIRRLRQTVYRPDFHVPDWAADAVIYYIFPERFRNGDPSNDPRPGKARYQDKDVEHHARWLERPFKPGTGDGSDDQYNNDFFGGDLAGIIDKLDEIHELGANTLYLTPIFRAASNHKYDTADYRHVDPGFGTDADFERLTREAARRGMRVIIDTSLNHTGSDSIYFDRYGNFGGQGAFAGGHINAASPYASWYTLDPAQNEPDRQFKGWVGVRDLPELDKSSPAWRRFAWGDADSVTRLWLQRGASGWRMDVAPWVSDDFWRGWRRTVKQQDPDALTVAETWFDASKHLLGDMFDSTMNYIFRNAVLDFAGGGPATALAAQLEHLREAYPPQAHAALMNLLSTHDQPRSLHLLGWHEGQTDPATIARAKQRLKLALFIQMTYPGAPAVFYGDEVGMTGAEDPYNRGPYPWADEGGQPDTALRAVFRQQIEHRNQHPVLRHGTLQAPAFVDESGIAWVRRLGPDWAVVAASRAEQPRLLRIPLPEGAPAGPWRPLDGGAPLLAVNGHLEIPLAPMSGVTYVMP